MRQYPVFHDIFEVLKLRLLHAALAEAGDRFERPPRFAGFEQFADFGDSAADQAFAELAGTGIRGGQRLGLGEIVPRGRRIRLLQEPFAALHVAAGQLREQFPGLLMPANGRLVEELLGLLEAAVLQRRPDLSQRQPACAEHGSYCTPFANEAPGAK